MAAVERELLFDNEVATVYWDGIAKCIEVEAIAAASTDQYRSFMTVVLQFIKERRARSIVADIAMLSNISTEDVVWTETEWLPSSQEAGLTFVAVVVPKALAAYLALEKMAIQSDKGGHGFVRRFFSDATMAREWIAEQ